MNELLYKVLIQTGAYLAVFLVTIIIFNFLTKGYLFTYIRVKASRGSKVLVRILGFTGYYYRAGSIDQSVLTFKNKQKNEDSYKIQKEDIFQEMLVNVSAPLLYLTYLSAILLIGILLTLISKELKLPNIIFLLFFGILLGHIEYHGAPLISFPGVFLSAISIITLAIIVFDSSSRFNMREFDTLSKRVVKLMFVFFLLTFLILGFVTKFVFKVELWKALLFSGLMSGTAPSVILFMFSESKARVIEILKIESIINTPLTVLVPFIILEFVVKVQNGVPKFDILFDQLSPFISLFIVGVGSGVVMGLIGARLMK